MSRTADILVKFVLPIAILGGAGAITARLIASREAPSRAEPEQQAVLVETERVQRRSHRLDVRASGTVEPARRVRVQPEVSGRVVGVHDNLEPGGLVEKGDTLVQIDRSDYQIAVRQRETALEQARSQLSLEKGQQEIAEREWELFQKEAGDLTDQTNPSLALREPQLASAKADLEAAKSRLEQARLNLERTTVEAPYDGLVLEESVSVGDLASAQSPLATLVATDTFWVRLKISPDKIPYIDIPNVNADSGSRVDISYDTGDETVEREGRVRRLVGGLERAGRLARVIVEIRDPLGLESRRDSDFRGVPLLLDSYVDARIRGGQQRELVEIPRSALRNGDEAYVFDDGKLAIRKLELVWERPSSVLVASGLEDGEHVIVGPMPNPLEGMPLKRTDDAAGNSDDNSERSGDADAGDSSADAETSGEGAGASGDGAPGESNREPSP